MREKLYSLHYLLKGLKTLSRASYEPPPLTAFVFIDYRDSATFDATSGYYHPTMKTVDGRIIPSSDRLLHDFLKRVPWTIESSNELTLFTRGESEQPRERHGANPVFEVGTHTQLLGIDKSNDILSKTSAPSIRLTWKFQGEREVFPWMALRLTRRGAEGVAFVTKGLCAPEAGDGLHEELWRIVATNELIPGDYAAEAIFIDNAKSAWSAGAGRNEFKPALLSEPVSIGEIKVIGQAR
jgi:hypothetical protein